MYYIIQTLLSLRNVFIKYCTLWPPALHLFITNPHILQSLVKYLSQNIKAVTFPYSIKLISLPAAPYFPCCTLNLQLEWAEVNHLWPCRRV